MFQTVRNIMSSGSMVGYFLQVVPITLLVAAVYCIVRFSRLKKEQEAILWGKELLRLVFVCYLSGLINLIVMPANFWLYVLDGLVYGWWEEIGTVFTPGWFNWVPTLFRYMQGKITIGGWMRAMLIGNVAMFLPFGFLLPLVTEKVRWRNIWWIALAVPLTMEFLQLFLGRSFDVDDLICNYIGIILGFLLAMAVQKFRRCREGSKTA